MSFECSRLDGIALGLIVFAVGAGVLVVRELGGYLARWVRRG